MVTMTKPLAHAFFAALLAAGVAAPAWAQLAPSPDASPISNAPALDPEDEQTPTLKIQVNMVDVFFTVTGKGSALVPHLTTGDCSVSEDKVPQTLKSFQSENNLPLTLGLVLDTSGSQEHVLPLEQDAGAQFIQRILRKKDQVFALSVDVNVDLLQDLTNDPRLISRALRRAEINAPAPLVPALCPPRAEPAVPSFTMLSTWLHRKK
jgi:hypothetical protein